VPGGALRCFRGLASDPATAVREAAATLSSSIQSAQATLLPDLQLLQSDVQSHNTTPKQK
jgi:hypothetical protein